MTGIDDYKYHVIQFLDKTYTGTPDYVCVPRSWVQPNDDEDNPVVKVWYPDEDHKYTERSVRKRKKKSSQWKSYLSIVKFSTDNYEDAKSYVLKEINQEKKLEDSNDDDKTCSQNGMNQSESTNGDYTKLSEKEKEKKSHTNSDDPVMNMLETMGWYISSKSTNDLTIKRKAPQQPVLEAPNKQTRESELDDSDNDFAISSSQAYKYKENHMSLTHEVSDEVLGTHETHVQKSNDSYSSKNRQTSKAKQSWDLEIFAKLTQSAMFPELCTLILDMKKVMGHKLFRQLLHKLLNTDDGHCSQNKYNIASALRDIITVVSKLNKEKINEEQPREKDIDFEPTRKKEIPKLKSVLTPEYNENDLKEENINDNDNSESLQRKSCPKRFKKVTQSPEHIANDSEEENNIQDESLKRKSCPKRFKKVTKSPEYVANDSEEQNYIQDESLKRKSYSKRFKNFFGPSDVSNDSYEESIEDDDDDNEESVKEKCSPKRAKKVVLPPDYDANDTRWTLKNRELKPGLVELEKGTGVYVSAVRLFHYKKCLRDGREFARKLLSEIFTPSALSTCSWTGSKARAYDRDGTNIRPGLDLEARTILLRYTSDYAKMKGWPNWDTKSILLSIRNKLFKMRP